MTLTGTRIAIVGSGIAGLSHAIALSRLGATVDVFEQASALREVGAALQISENGAKALDHLGVYQAIASYITPSPLLQIYDYRAARPMLELPFGTLRPQYRQGRILRWDLISVLYRAACEGGCTFHFDAAIRSADPSGALICADGRTAHYDWIIGADGVNSALRPVVNPSATPHFTGQVAWRALTPTQSTRPEICVVMAPRRHLVIYDIAGYRNIVAVEECNDWTGHSWRQEGRTVVLQQLFADVHPRWQADLASITSTHKWGLHSYRHADRVRRGRILLVGDAAHPTLPFMAQGACLAVEGAAVLSTAIAASDMDGAVQTYAARHMPRARKVVAQAARNGTSFHLPHGPKRMLAHGALRAAHLTGGRAMIGRWDWIYGYDPTL